MSSHSNPNPSQPPFPSSLFTIASHRMLPLPIPSLSLKPIVMKVQHFRPAAFCDQTTPNSSFKRLRPLAPKLTCSTDHHPTKPTNCTNVSPSGGTRWNPTAEQVRKLEALYRGGMRTPNARQIEEITEELGKYGRIEGKNVFYWFQNHKARERQKQKRSAAALLALQTANYCPPSFPDSIMSFFSTSHKEGGEEESRNEGSDVSGKRKSRSWGSATELEIEGCGGDGTLELFPLHPEGGRS